MIERIKGWLGIKERAWYEVRLLDGGRVVAFAEARIVSSRPIKVDVDDVEENGVAILLRAVVRIERLGRDVHRVDGYEVRLLAVGKVIRQPLTTKEGVPFHIDVDQHRGIGTITLDIPLELR